MRRNPSSAARGSSSSVHAALQQPISQQQQLHLLVQEGLSSGEGFVELLRPAKREVESVLSRMVRQLSRVFAEEEPAWPEDGFETLRLEAAQLRLLPDEERNVERGSRRVAVGLPREALVTICPRFAREGPTVRKQ